jgi:uncharacterized protein (TIGR02171 family)
MRLFIYIAVVLLLCACSNSEWNSEPQLSQTVGCDEDSLSGMMRVDAKGVEVALGTNSENARANERPQMQVKFDYGFSLARHEVICGEFDALMERATGLVLKCANDSLPATNITYYDAVLFANERSKAEGFDTAYTYTSASFDAEKHCTNLEGLAYHPEVKSYRLPTEAEWVLAASLNWDPQSGWTAENSDYKLHPVCGKRNAEDKFCDLIGNAMEWMNDWLGKFVDTTLSNYVGAPDGGALGQRIVKGGSYRNTLESVNLYNRGDVYTVTSSTRADYVGFRLAFGAIPGAVWMGNDGRANDSRMVSLVNSATIRSLVGTYKAKVAFRNDLTGNLAYIDYSGGIRTVVEIVDTIEVYHPEISPDGRHVAFCTGLEGVSGSSSLYVRDLNAEGSNLVKLDVESAVIPRWRVLENGDTVIVYVTDAGNNKDESSFKSASTWQVKFSNGKFGTPQKLFNGAYHGGISEDNTLAITGARLLRARFSGRDTVWYNGEQACNASLSKDGRKRTLFLDFGGKTGQSFVGKDYAMHEQLLIADSTGKLMQSVAAPSGFTFDHSEWASGASNKVVATLSNSNGLHQKIVVIDLTDSSLTELVSGDELWHPCLWVNSNASSDDALLNLDSAGFYFESHSENVVQSSSVETAMKLQMFWRDYHSLECFLLGSSMIMDAVNDSLITTYKSLNMGITLADIYMFRYLLQNYIFPYADNVKAVVLELSPGLLFRSEGFYLDSVRHYSPGLIYDEHHLNAENKDAIAALSLEYTYPRNFFSQDYMENTFLMPSVSWGDTYIFSDVSWMTFDNYDLNHSMEVFDSLKVEMDRRNIKLVLAVTPRNPAYAETEGFGFFGPSREVARAVINRFVEKGYVVFDENKDGKHDYTPKMAYNNIHLSYIGAEQFTSRLDSLLKTLK